MRIDKGVYLTFGMAVVCILLTIVAIGAKAEDRMPPQPQPVVSQVSARALDPAREIISRQLDAIYARNAALAWSLTTKSMHEKYDTPKEYLAHLRFKLRPIYNHEGYEFVGPAGGENNIQKVEMQTRYGDPVTVIYRLEQENGKWLIDSFAILPQDDAQPI